MNGTLLLLISLAAALLSPSPGVAQRADLVDPLKGVRGLLEEALDRLDLTPAELGFEKKREDPYTQMVVSRVLDEPLGLPARMNAHRQAAKELLKRPRILSLACMPLALQSLDLIRLPSPMDPDPRDQNQSLAELLSAAAGEKMEAGDLAHLPQEIQAVVRAALRGQIEMRALWKKAWGTPLDETARLACLRGLSGLWIEDGALAAVLPEGDTVGEALLSEAALLSPDRLRLAVRTALRRLEIALVRLRSMDPKKLPPRMTAPGVEGDIRFSMRTPMGHIVIGGPGRSRVDVDTFVLIDFGGDDEYRGRVAGASPAWNRYFAVSIDMGGNDEYRSGKSLDQGAALFGLGVLIDRGKGDDRYLAQDLAQGAAVMGVGILHDDGGSDRYEGRGLVQGAAGFGDGLLLDEAGSDVYRAARYAQAFAGVQGFGVLIDGTGDDLYQAGGLYRHTPLLPDQYQSLSQGFAIGDRYKKASGGVAFLYDGAGNDNYLCEVYGQGASYWMSLGMLVDEEGNDRYLCTQYGQGAGIHLSVGGLWDLKGKDSYTLHLGVGQGGGHDLSVGWLIDGEGNDYYQGSGLNQGAGGSNSVGILIDGAGNDCYAGGNGAANKKTFPQFQGYGKAARGYGSVGLLLDVKGVDVFSHRGEGESWERGDRGLVWDRKVALPKKEKARWTLPRPLPRSEPANFRKYFDEAALWGVGSNEAKVERARAILREMGPAAWRWILTNEFDAETTLKRRALRASIPHGKVGLVANEIEEQLASKDWRRRLNALWYYLDLDKDDSAAWLTGLLTTDPDPRVRREVIRLLGKLGKKDCVLPLSRIAKESGNDGERRAAMAALDQIPDKKAVHVLADLLGEKSFTLRGAARNALARQKSLSLEIGLSELMRAEGPALREWLRLFAIWKEPRARKALSGRVQNLGDVEAARKAKAILENLADGSDKKDDSGTEPKTGSANHPKKDDRP